MSKKKSAHEIPKAPNPTTSPSQPFNLLERPGMPELLLFVSAWLVFGWSVNNGFVFFDDDKAILYNKALQSPSLIHFFTGQNLGMYAPFSWMAYWVGKLISGQNAWGYHLVSLLLHSINGMLVYSTLRLLLSNIWVAFSAALLFVVHPMQTEAVCWAAALSTVLYSTFYLASARAYLMWLQAQKASISGYLGALLLFLGAILSKSAAVTLPLLLIAFDFFVYKKLRRNFWLSKIPYLILSLIFGYYTFITREAEGHDIETASQTFNLLDRFFMVCQTLLFYPVKLLLPFNYSIAYPFVKENGAFPPFYYLAPLILVALGALIWWKWRDKPNYLLALAWYFLPLCVMLPFRTVGSFELRSDRYIYLSCIGIFLLIAFALEKANARYRDLGLITLVSLLGFLAWKQSTVWKEGVALFKNCVEKTPESSLCQCNLAYNELLNLQYQESIDHYTEALHYDPSVVEAYNGRGQAYMQLRRFPEALGDFQKAIQAGIITPKLFLNRGKCLVILNKPEEAIPDLNKSIELEPKNPETWYFLAVAKEKTNDLPGAAADYSKALQLQPDYLEALVNQGLVYVKLGKYSEAINDYSQALKINPNMEMIWNNRAYAFLQKGDPGNGVSDASKAIELNRKYAKAYQTRGFLYQALGQMDKANADFQMAAQLGLK